MTFSHATLQISLYLAQAPADLLVLQIPGERGGQEVPEPQLALSRALARAWSVWRGPWFSLEMCLVKTEADLPEVLAFLVVYLWEQKCKVTFKCVVRNGRLC
jgi:hypothetical protein